MCELSIVIPNLNEAQTIETCILQANKSVSENNITAEIIVCDNGSEDGSDILAKNAGAKVVYCKQKGYGNALLAGINSAKGKYILICDADNTYNLLSSNEFLNAAKADENICMVLGNRFKAPKSSEGGDFHI